MKKPIRFFLIVALAIVNFQSFAQIFGVKAGLNITNCALNRNEIFPFYNKVIFGINLGGTVEFKITDKYYLETGLTFNEKGMKVPITYGNDIITQLRYLDIPVNFKYKFVLGGNKLFLSGGPYLGLGIRGFILSKDLNGELSGSKVQWGNNGTANEIRRLDYGINLGAEYEFGKFGIGVQYGIGLANMRGTGYEFNSQHNRVLSIYLAYKFGKKAI